LGSARPRNVPTEIVDRLNREINIALADPGIKARLANLGTAPLPMTSTDFGKLLADQTEKWGKVIRAGNIKPE
jgi:tripartite-type tricarboxylate transporter receptor subunit TctC